MLLVENKASGPFSSKKLLNLMQVVLPIARFGLKSSPVIFTRVRFLALNTALWKSWAKWGLGVQNVTDGIVIGVAGTIRLVKVNTCKKKASETLANASSKNKTPGIAS